MSADSGARPIVIVQPHLLFGGAERQTVLLANALVAQDHKCTVILHSLSGGLIADLDERVHLISLGSPGHIRVPIAAWRLKKALAQLEPSFIIVKLWSSIMAAALIDRTTPQHVFNYCEDLDPADHADYIRFGRIKQRIVRSIFRRRPLLTANTRQVARSMVDVYGLSREPDVVSSAIDVDLVQNRAASEGAKAANLRDDALNVVTVGSLIERKGLRGIWNGLREAAIPIRWHVVGDGPLREWLASLEDEQVDVMTYGGHANPYRIMRAADLMVHGATSEAFGIVILESLAVDTPVLAARSIGPTEMVDTLGQNTRLLQLFDPADVEELGRKLRERASRTDGSTSPSGSDYVMPYSLSYTVRNWLERAAHE